MNKILFVLFAILSLSSKAQRKAAERIYLWDQDFKPVQKAELATFFTSIVKINDSLWQWDTYNMAGPMITSEQFKSADGKELTGRFIQYQYNGYIDSIGKVINGRPDGNWVFYNDTGRA